jgi:hypothetical protein
MTPEQEHQARQHGHELVRLTGRWGEWYRIWSAHGLWWASRDGDKLSGDSRPHWNPCYAITWPYAGTGHSRTSEKVDGRSSPSRPR